MIIPRDGVPPQLLPGATATGHVPGWQKNYSNTMSRQTHSPSQSCCEPTNSIGIDGSRSDSGWMTTGVSMRVFYTPNGNYYPVAQWLIPSLRETRSCWHGACLPGNFGVSIFPYWLSPSRMPYLFQQVDPKRDGSGSLMEHMAAGLIALARLADAKPQSDGTLGASTKSGAVSNKKEPSIPQSLGC